MINKHGVISHSYKKVKTGFVEQRLAYMGLKINDSWTNQSELLFIPFVDEISADYKQSVEIFIEIQFNIHNFWFLISWMTILVSKYAVYNEN